MGDPDPALFVANGNGAPGQVVELVARKWNGRNNLYMENGFYENGRALCPFLDGILLSLINGRVILWQECRRDLSHD